MPEFIVDIGVTGMTYRGLLNRFRLCFSPGAIIFVLVYLGVVYFFQEVNVWENYFVKSNIIYLPYNIFRVIFLVYFAWLVYFSGGFLVLSRMRLLHDGDFDNFDFTLLCCFSGCSLYILIGFLLSFINCLYPIILAIVTGLPLWLSYSEFKGMIKKCFSLSRGVLHKFKHWLVSAKIENFLFLLISLLVIAQLINIFISTVLYPRSISNDVPGNYLPYYEDVIHVNHGFWPSNWWDHFFISKGAGLHFIAMSLSDTHSCKLVNFYLLVLTALILFRSIYRISGHIVWGMLSLFLFLSSTMAFPDYVKMHLAIGAYMVFLIYFLSKSCFWHEQTIRSIRYSLLIILLSIPIFYPVSTYVVVTVLSFFIAISVFQHRKHFFFYCQLELIVIFSLTGLYILNYCFTGMLDFQMPIYDWFINAERFEKWFSKVMVMLYRDTGHHETQVSNLFHLKVMMDNLYYLFSEINLLRLRYALYLFLLIFLIQTIYYLIQRNKKTLLNRDYYMYFPTIFIMAITIGLHTLLPGSNSIKRFSSYNSFFAIWLFVMTLFFVTHKLVPNRFRRASAILLICLAIYFNTPSYAVTIKFALSGNNYLSPPQAYHILAASNTVHYLLPRIRFLYGKVNYGQAYNAKWDFTENYIAQQAVAFDGKILMMNLSPAASLYPGTKFRRPFCNEARQDLHKIYFGTPEEAKDAFIAAGINYFHIDTRKHPPLFNILSPLFLPQNINKYLSLIRTGREKYGSYLLTFRKEGDPHLPSQFLAEYSQLFRRGILFAQNYLRTQKCIREHGLSLKPCP